MPPCNPSVALARTLVPPPLTIQAEGLVLQRSMSLSGYKHVGRDMNKPRPFQVKMWQNGKQARLVVAPRSGLRSTELQLPYSSHTVYYSAGYTWSCIL